MCNSGYDFVSWMEIGDVSEMLSVMEIRIGMEWNSDGCALCLDESSEGVEWFWDGSFGGCVWSGRELS